jgi:hypothetical protein
MPVNYYNRGNWTVTDKNERASSVTQALIQGNNTVGLINLFMPKEMFDSVMTEISDDVKKLKPEASLNKTTVQKGITAAGADAAAGAVQLAPIRTKLTNFIKTYVNSFIMHFGGSESLGDRDLLNRIADNNMSIKAVYGNTFNKFLSTNIGGNRKIQDRELKCENTNGNNFVLRIIFSNNETVAEERPAPLGLDIADAMVKNIDTTKSQGEKMDDTNGHKIYNIRGTIQQGINAQASGNADLPTPAPYGVIPHMSVSKSHNYIEYQVIDKDNNTVSVDENENIMQFRTNPMCQHIASLLALIDYDHDFLDSSGDRIAEGYTTKDPTSRQNFWGWIRRLKIQSTIGTNVLFILRKENVGNWDALTHINYAGNEEQRFLDLAVGNVDSFVNSIHKIQFLFKGEDDVDKTISNMGELRDTIFNKSNDGTLIVFIPGLILVDEDLDDDLVSTAKAKLTHLITQAKANLAVTGTVTSNINTADDCGGLRGVCCHFRGVDITTVVGDGSKSSILYEAEPQIDSNGKKIMGLRYIGIDKHMYGRGIFKQIEKSFGDENPYLVRNLPDNKKIYVGGTLLDDSSKYQDDAQNPKIAEAAAAAAAVAGDPLKLEAAKIVESREKYKLKLFGHYPDSVFGTQFVRDCGSLDELIEAIMGYYMKQFGLMRPGQKAKQPLTSNVMDPATEPAMDPGLFHEYVPKTRVKGNIDFSTNSPYNPQIVLPYMSLYLPEDINSGTNFNTYVGSSKKNGRPHAIILIELKLNFDGISKARTYAEEMKRRFPDFIDSDELSTFAKQRAIMNEVSFYVFTPDKFPEDGDDFTLQTCYNNLHDSNKFNKYSFLQSHKTPGVAGMCTLFMEYGYNERDTVAITDNTNFFNGTNLNYRPLAFSDQSWTACMMEIGHIIALDVRRSNTVSVSGESRPMFIKDPYRANYKRTKPHKMLPWAGKNPNAKSITGAGKGNENFKKLRTKFNSKGMYSVGQIAYLFATTFKTFGDKFRYIDSYIFGIPMETCDSFLVIVSIVGGCMVFYTYGGKLLFIGPVFSTTGGGAPIFGGVVEAEAKRIFKEMSMNVSNTLTKLNNVNFDEIETEEVAVWNAHKLQKPLTFKKGDRLVTQELLYKLHFSKALLIILSYNILNRSTLGVNRTVIVSGGNLINELTLTKNKLNKFWDIFDKSVPEGGTNVPPHSLDYFLNELLIILWDKYEDITINYGSRAAIRDMHNFYFPLDSRRRSPEDLSDKLNNFYEYTKGELDRYISARDVAVGGAWTHIYGTDNSYGIDEMLHHLGLDLTSTSLTYDFYNSSDDYPKQHTKTEIFKELQALIPSAIDNITSLAQTIGGGKNQEGGVKVMVREQAREPLRREQYDFEIGADYSISHSDYFRYRYKVERDPRLPALPYTQSLNHSEMISSIIFYELINTGKFQELNDSLSHDITTYKYSRLVTRVGELGEAIVRCLQVTFQKIEDGENSTPSEVKSEQHQHQEDIDYRKHIQGLHKSLSGILEKKIIIDRTVKNDKYLSTITVPFGSVQFNVVGDDRGYTTKIKQEEKPFWLSKDVDIEKLIQDFNLSANSIFLKFKNLEEDHPIKLEILKKQFGLNMLHILDLICVKMYYVLSYCCGKILGGHQNADKIISTYFLPDKKRGEWKYGPFDISKDREPRGTKNHSQTYAKMYQLMDTHYSLKSIKHVFVHGNNIGGIINLPYYGCLELEANYSITTRGLDIRNILKGEFSDLMSPSYEGGSKTQRELATIINSSVDADPIIGKKIDDIVIEIQAEIFAIIDLLGDVYFFYNGKTYTTLLDAYDAMEFFNKTIDKRSEQNKYTLPLEIDLSALFTSLFGLSITLEKRKNLPSNFFEEDIQLNPNILLVNKDLSFVYENVNKLFSSKEDPLKKLQIIIELIIQRNINITVADLVKIVRQVHGIIDVEDVEDVVSPAQLLQLHEISGLLSAASVGYPSSETKDGQMGFGKRKTQKIRLKRRKKKTKSNTRQKGKKMTKKIIVSRKNKYTRRKKII